MNGIIFDLDGVLVHTDEFHYQAWKLLADRMGLPFNRSVNNRLRGVSRMESLEIILEQYNGPELSEQSKARLAEEKNREYCAFLAQMTPADVDDQVRDTLQELRRRGYRLAVGSSSRNAKTILERTGLTEFFDALSDGTNITRSKPDPEVFLKAADFLSEAPENCAVVEDAHSGIQAAKAARMQAVAMGDAAGDPLADISISQFAELLEIFR